MTSLAAREGEIEFSLTVFEREGIVKSWSKSSRNGRPRFTVQLTSRLSTIENMTTREAEILIFGIREGRLAPDSTTLRRLSPVDRDLS